MEWAWFGVEKNTGVKSENIPFPDFTRVDCGRPRIYPGVDPDLYPRGRLRWLPESTPPSQDPPPFIVIMWSVFGYQNLSDRQTDRQTDSFILPIYNTIWWGRLLLRHKHMSLSKEPPYNNDKQWITLYIKYTYRPVMWVRRLLNVTYWKGRSGKWLCYSLKTVQTVDEKWMMYRWWDEAEYIL